MAIWFSKSRGGFYDDAIHGAKGTKGSKIPKDAVGVSGGAHAALMEAQGEGQRILVGEEGAPVAGVYTPSSAEILAQLRLKRDRDLAGSDWTQMTDNGLSAEQRAAWGIYRQQLRDYIGLVGQAIADEEAPLEVPYPVPPQVTAPPAPPAPPPPPEGFPEPDVVGQD